LAVELTIGKIAALAAADAVNPCAIAVLVLVLISILTYNPKNKAKVLQAGMAFTAAVYILYLIYGLIIIQLFKGFTSFVSIVEPYLYSLLAIVAIILGALHVKDFARYAPGGLATEMPMKLRPGVKKLISRVTSPKGAFFVGIFVTLFLLPCTIGPYLITSGILSALDILKTIPWLLFYNVIFVLPMVVITLIIYAGISTVEQVGGWKEKNIIYLHLIAGLILMSIGIAMLFGWI